MAFPLVRMLLGSLLVLAPLPLTFIGTRFFFPDKSMRIMWPQLLAIALCLGMYHLYVRVFEKRAVHELSRARAVPELVAGVLAGALLVSLVMGTLAVLGVYQVTGNNPWTVMIVPSAELLLVAIFEETVFRGIIFRTLEKSLGSRIALVLSAVIFAAAHLPNDGISVLAVAELVAAGLLLAGAYMVTQRLWFPIGIHFAWNYCIGQVFSVTVSGHENTGFLIGRLVGADWMTGGAFGVEASAVALAFTVLAALCLIVRAHYRGAMLARSWKARTGGQVPDHGGF